MDYKDISLSYPSLEFLRDLTFHMKYEIFQEPMPFKEKFKGMGVNLPCLKPLLDEWYFNRDYWYAQDVIRALEQLINAKVYVNRKLSQDDEGLLFLGSEQLHNKEKELENNIMSLLKLN